MDTPRTHCCLKCNSNFSNIFNLRRHVRKSHPESVDDLAPMKNKNGQLFAFSCTICKKNFNYKKNFTFHMKTCHAAERAETDRRPEQHNEVDGTRSESTTTTCSSEPTKISHRKSSKCPLCDYSVVRKKQLLEHFKTSHDIEVSCKQIKLSSPQKFYEWKREVETTNNLKFVVEKVEKLKSKKVTFFACHRSGNYRPEGAGLRHLKTQGSCKINGYCPAGIKKTEYLDHNVDKLDVLYTETHIGHQTEIEHITLSREERKNLAMKIAAKIPFDDILDEIRESISNEELRRIHLVTKKDLFNIEQSFNLSSDAVRHANDAVSVDAFVNQMRKEGNTILFYKSQGTLLQEHPELQKDDFVLMLMNTAQEELLKKYGSDCVCLDGTHGLNSYNFELNTVLILDDMREGFPAAFLISNRSDSEIFKLFFSEIKARVGLLTPNIFMSDLANAFYNAWIGVMGMPQKRLFCCWHVDHAWRKNLSLVTGKENQVTIYKQLRILLEERDACAFEIMIQNFCANPNPVYRNFIEYFNQNYVKNRQHWAYCYRLHAGINTNMHLERLHLTIKYAYLKGKRVKRLDKGIYAIMKLTRNKLIDRLICIHKGKISDKLKNIRKRHEHFKHLDSTLLIKVEHGWELPSKKTNEVYFIQKYLESCDCRLICSKCNICIHQYYCSCPDSAIKFNMCKHIHLVAQCSSRVEAKVTAEAEANNLECSEADEGSDENLLFIHENKVRETDEAQAIISHLSKKRPSNCFEEEKEKTKQNILKYFDGLQSPSKLELIKKAIAPISPILAAAAAGPSTKTFPTLSQSFPPNAKIAVQRRLFSTKKASKKNKSVTRLKKPDVQETQKITFSLLKNQSDEELLM